MGNKTQNTSDIWVDTKTAMSETGKSARTLSRWLNAGKLPRGAHRQKQSGNITKNYYNLRILKELLKNLPSDTSQDTADISVSRTVPRHDNAESKALSLIIKTQEEKNKIITKLEIKNNSKSWMILILLSLFGISLAFLRYNYKESQKEAKEIKSQIEHLSKKYSLKLKEIEKNYSKQLKERKEQLTKQEQIMKNTNNELNQKESEIKILKNKLEIMEKIEADYRV